APAGAGPSRPITPATAVSHLRAGFMIVPPRRASFGTLPPGRAPNGSGGNFDFWLLAPFRGPMSRKSSSQGPSTGPSGPIFGSRIAGESFGAHQCRLHRNRCPFFFRCRDRTRNRPIGQLTKPDLASRPDLPLSLHRQPAPKNANPVRNHS